MASTWTSSRYATQSSASIKNLRHRSQPSTPTISASRLKISTPRAAFGRTLAERVDRLNAQRLDDATREQLRAELDALMFHVHGI